MSRELLLRNRQRVRRINSRLFRQIAETVLVDLLSVENYELGIHIVREKEMAGVNMQFLQHEGSTDVITFDHGLGVSPSGGSGRVNAELQTLYGEIFICIDDAIAQARQFKTTWQSEIVRYVIHGILHLLGHDDTRPAARAKMKREENRLLRRAARRFALSKL